MKEAEIRFGTYRTSAAAFLSVPRASRTGQAVQNSCGMGVVSPRGDVCGECDPSCGLQPDRQRCDLCLEDRLSIVHDREAMGAEERARVMR